MSQPIPTLDEAVKAAARQRAAREPLDLAELAAYRQGRLDAARRAELEERLLWDREAAELAADFDLLSGAAPVPPTDTRTAWRRFRRRSEAAAPRWWERPSLAWGTAGALLLVTAFLGVWGLEQSRRARWAEAPRANVAVVSLVAPPGVRAESAPVRTLRPDGAGRVVLVVTPGERAAAGRSLSARLLDERGGEVWSARGLVPNAEGAVTLEVTAAAVGPLGITLELQEEPGGRLLGRLGLRFEPAP